MTDLILKIHELAPSEGHILIGIVALIVIFVAHDVYTSAKAK